MILKSAEIILICSFGRFNKYPSIDTAGLKASLSRKDRKDKKDNKDKKDKKEMSGGDTGGDGSLSSGSSIITISSVSNSDPDPDCHHNSHGSGRDIREERWYHTVMQVSIPFFIAGIGTIGAGLVLNEVKVRVFSLFP